MDFITAVKRLKDGQAMRPSGWLGYLKREAIEVKELDLTQPLTMGYFYRYNGEIWLLDGPDGTPPYHPPREGFVEEDGVSWRKVKVADTPHQLVMVQKTPTSPKTEWVSFVNLTGEDIFFESWVRRNGSAVMSFDGELLTAILRGDWKIGSVEDFENDRIATGSIW